MQQDGHNGNLQSTSLTAVVRLSRRESGRIAISLPMDQAVSSLVNANSPHYNVDIDTSPVWTSVAMCSYIAKLVKLVNFRWLRTCLPTNQWTS